MAIKSTTIAGNLKHTIIRMRPGEHKGKRKKKSKPSTESVRRTNERIAERNLSILLANNFQDGDYHVTLTYRNEPTPEESKKILDNFLKRLRRLYRREETELKWILVTEYHGHRLHHHLVINRLEWEKVKGCWKEGGAFIQELYTNGDYRRLASYFIKETSKTFRESEIQKTRFRHSKTVTYPPTKEEEVSAALIAKDPKASPGYIVDPDSVYRGTNLVNGTPYLEYVEVLDGPKKYDIWPRGKKKKYRERYYKAPPEDKQMTWEDVYGKECESR